MSRAGLSYRSANGDPIRNLGQTTVQFENGNHRKCVMPFQLAEVERPLISVARLVDAGHRVYFGPTGGFIAHIATGRRLPLTRDGNAYTLEMLLPRAEGVEEERKEAGSAEGRPHGLGQEAKASGTLSVGFARQERH